MEAMIFGFCLISSDINIFLLLSYKTYKKTLLAVCFSLLSLALTWVTVHFWKLLLISSGKDTAQKAKRRNRIGTGPLPLGRGPSIFPYFFFWFFS